MIQNLPVWRPEAYKMWAGSPGYQQASEVMEVSITVVILEAVTLPSRMLHISTEVGLAREVSRTDSTRRVDRWNSGTWEKG